MDTRFTVKVLARTENPQTLIYQAMHQDYSERFVANLKLSKTEAEYGELVVRRVVKPHHWGPLEHPQITFNAGYFPHSVLQQARTHRVGTSFDTQSFRYTGQNILDVADEKKELEDVFYLRPVGKYYERTGKHYEYTEELRSMDLERCFEAARHYKKLVEEHGFSYEHARGLLPFDYRQHFVCSFNLRSVLHFMDMRHKKDAQLEIQHLAHMMWEHVLAWTPEVANWYEDNRLGKGRLAP